MTDTRELLAERHDHFKAAEKLLNVAKAAGRDISDAELKQFNETVSRIKAIDQDLDRIEKSRGAGFAPIVRDRTMPGGPRNMDEVPPTPLPGGALFQQASEGWTDPRTGRPVAVLKPEQKMTDLAPDSLGYEGPLSLGAYVRGVVTGKWTGAEREMQAMSEGSLGGGGYLLPSPLSGQIIDKVRNATVMIKAGARTVPMDNATLSIARIAQDATPMWHTEAEAITASDMTFERVTLTAQTLAAICVLSVELFEDTNVDTVVSDAIAKVLALELDRACLRGTGTAPQPRGILAQTGVVIDATTFGTDGSVISASAPTAGVAWDWVSKQVSALWGVNEAPNAAIYSARTAGELDLLRATTGEVLPPPGSVSKLNLLFTNAIPNNLTHGGSSDCSEAYVGDFNQALIGIRNELVLEVSRHANVGSTSLFSTMQVGIRAYLRADFQLARPAAFRVVTGIR